MSIRSRSVLEIDTVSSNALRAEREIAIEKCNAREKQTKIHRGPYL